MTEAVVRTKVQYGSSPSQFFLTHRPNLNSPLPIAIIIHGGFWKSKYGISPPTACCETLATDIALHEMLAIEVEYRRNGDQLWGWPYSNHDILQAFRRITTLPNIDITRIFVLGHSSGGTLALWLASYLYQCNDTIQPLSTYALAPVADLRMAVELRLSDDGDAVQRYMHGDPGDIPKQYEEACPTEHAAALARRNVCLVLGKDDKDIPKALVTSLYNKIESAQTALPLEQKGSLQMHVFELIDHYAIVRSDSTAWESIRSDMLKHIRE